VYDIHWERNLRNNLNHVNIVQRERITLRVSKTLRSIGLALVLMLLLAVVLFTKVDVTPYHQTDFYQNTLARKDSLDKQLEQQLGPANARQQVQLRAGWSLANITPSKPVRLTGKNFKPYQHVFDSVFVRTFLFDNGVNRVLLINYDLWIMHPVLADAVRAMIDRQFPDVTGVYFTANHSHTSIGGWASGLLGEIVVGGNHPETVDFIVDQTRHAITRAQQQLDTASVGYGEMETEGLVMNRLDENGQLDNKLRVLKMTNTRNQSALFNTYSAHSVFMNKDINTLSADYPGPFLSFLEEQAEVEFAAFAPGATGSHTPVGRKPFEHIKMRNYARKLAQYASDLQGQIKTKQTGMLKYLEWPVELRSPHFRITNHWRVRPWLFDMVMGKPRAHITVLRIDDIVLVGLPVELSGEYYADLEQAYRQKGLSLMITSFNGWYLGYVNPEKYYFTLKRAETREMNWFGYQNGEYFADLVKQVLDVI
jgi:hypothetical protein